MNILYAKMQGYEWVSTPSDAVARELVALGHNVVLAKDIDYIPPMNYDFVWSPYESATIFGHYLSVKYDIPHYAHIEWLPPWRIFKNCDVENYGIHRDFKELSYLDQSIQHYKIVGDKWLKAKWKSIFSKGVIPYHQRFLNATDEEISMVNIKKPAIDVKTILDSKNAYCPIKNKKSVVTIARLSPNKRYDLLINIINSIKTDFTWTVIGDGTELDYIKANVNNTSVTLNLVGSLWGWGRLYEMLKHKILLFSFSAMPPIEASLLGLLPVGINQPKTRDIPDMDTIIQEHFDESIYIGQYTEPQITADYITKLLSVDSFLRTEIEERQVINHFMDNKMGVRSANEIAKQIIEIVSE